MKILNKILNVILDLVYIYCRAIPLLYALVLFFHPIHIYIPEWRAELSPTFSPYVFLLIWALWRFCTPFHKCLVKKRRSLISFLFYNIPVQILLLLEFAQYQAGWAVAVLILAAALPIAFRIWIKHDEKTSGADKAEKRENLMISRRFTIIAVSLCLLVPTTLCVFIYGSGSPVYYYTDVGTGISLYETDTEGTNRPIPVLSDNLKKQLKEDEWNKLSFKDKVIVMQELANYESEYLGIPPLTVKTTRIDEYTYGSYRPGNNYLTIDIKHLTDDEVESVAKTILHEVFHEFEFYIVVQTDWSAPLTKTYYFDKAALWKANLASYTSGKHDYKSYHDQPLEASSNAYAAIEWARLRDIINGTDDNHA